MTNSIVQDEIRYLIAQDDALLGKLFNLMESGTVEPKEIVATGICANVGVVSNYKQILRTLISGNVPNSSHLAARAKSSIKGLLASSTEHSDELLAHFSKLSQSLESQIQNREAILHDTNEILDGSQILSKKATEIRNAVYVYSFPTYLHFGSIDNPDLKWLKIGSTKNAVWQRIVEQNRQTSMPEDPVLIRIYHSVEMDVSEIERKFHDTLQKVGHEQSSATRTKAGKEWFATTEEALDALAILMKLEIESGFEF